MKDVVSNSTMRTSDAAKIASGTESKSLMRAAGEAVFRAILADTADRAALPSPVAIVCGTGNNAGDGYVIADLVKRSGIDAVLILAEDAFSPDGRYFFDIACDAGVRRILWSDGVMLDNYPIIVDCLFGTGFHGTPDRPYSDMIAAINAAHMRGARVFAVDIPSGLSGDTGMGDSTVQADVTYSIGTLKSGHFLGKAKDHVGKLTNLDINIPIVGEVYHLIEPSDLLGIIAPRNNFCNKGDFGYVALIGGCADYSGAAKLANLAMSALRSGCGVSKLVVPDCISDAVAPYLLESTLTALPSIDGHMRFDRVALDRAMSKIRAAAVGMGWGMSDGNCEILSHILDNYAIPLVIDADGLNTLAKIGVDRLRGAKCRIILTPHLTEFERLSGISRSEVLRDPIGYAKGFAQKYSVILLLKGPTTLITDGETVCLCDRGCAGMATAGSGDVLSGILAGLLGYSVASPLLTAACGAWINGRAGELAESRSNAISMTSGDTVKAIPDAVSEILKIREREDCKA